MTTFFVAFVEIFYDFIQNIESFRRISQGILKDGQESCSKIQKLFSMNNYAKTATMLFVALPYERLPTNFQLNIFIFEARASLQTLLQSLKQNANNSALKKPKLAFLYMLFSIT